MERGAAGEHPIGDGIENQPFSRLHEHDDSGHLLQHILKLCAPPCTAHPAVLWRCPSVAGFLREAVREVRSTAGVAEGRLCRWRARMGQIPSWRKCEAYCESGRCLIYSVLLLTRAPPRSLPAWTLPSQLPLPGSRRCCRQCWCSGLQTSTSRR